MGKTTFAMNLCEHAALTADKPVLIFSLEMPSEQIIMRMLASVGRIDQTKVRTGQLDDEDWARLSSTMGLLLEKGKMYIDDASGLTPTDVRSRARRIAREHGGLSMIMIDYLQLMRVPALSDNRTLEIGEISRSLKALAKELQCPVVALSQLNRSLEQRADKRPVNSDLRESGSIEQDADLIMFIYRDEVYHDDSPDKGIAEIIIGKQRNGPIGRVRLTFQGQFSRFDNYAGQILARTPLMGAGFQQGELAAVDREGPHRNQRLIGGRAGIRDIGDAGSIGRVQHGFHGMPVCFVLGAWPWAGSR
jgi:replicative DNA helicase